MKVLFCGDTPTIPTGFALCTKAVCDELVSQGHEVNVLGLNYWGDPYDRDKYPYNIYPPFNPLDDCRNTFGVHRLPKLIERLQPDVVVLLNDPWNVNDYLEFINGFNEVRATHKLPQVSIPPIVGWMAVDSENTSGRDLNKLSKVAVWTNFGSRVLQDGGLESEPLVIPLGVDHELYYPRDKVEARGKLLPSSIDSEAFIVGVVGRNQPRKRLDLTLKYFADWVSQDRVENVYLWLHVAPTGDRGVDIESLVSYYNLNGKVMIPNVAIGTGIRYEDMPLVYSMLDVYLSTSQCEGFGLPCLEAMACGIPCIVPDFAGLSSVEGWVGDAVMPVPCFTTAPSAPLNDRMSTLGAIPDHGATVEALRALYEDVELRKSLSTKGLQHAKNFSWSRTGGEFVDMLEEVVESYPETDLEAKMDELDEIAESV